MIKSYELIIIIMPSKDDKISIGYSKLFIELVFIYSFDEIITKKHETNVKIFMKIDKSSIMKLWLNNLIFSLGKLKNKSIVNNKTIKVRFCTIL